jgi:hypothetical protein
MTQVRDYLGSHKYLRVALLAVGFVIASFSLYMGTAIYLLIQYGDNLLIVFFFLLALILDFGIGWTLHRQTGRSFRLSILFSSAGIAVGAVVTSILVWREHWIQVIKELFV